MRAASRVVLNSFAPVPGFSASGIHAGLKKNGILDMAMFVSDRPCTAAGLFTTNVFAAPPVIYDKQLLSRNSRGTRGVVINTRVANACTGEEGLRNSRAFSEMAEGQLGFEADTMFNMSTGVIGPQLPLPKLARGVELLTQSLDSTADGWQRAARGMMTTDTRPKHAFIELPSGYVIGGCIKGAGMINPSVATMLTVICTNAAIPQPLLQAALSGVADESFNAATIDGDTSTNDTVLALANGAGGVRIEKGRLLTEFSEALAELSRALAVEMIRDGEGATKLVTVRVINAPSKTQAASVAKTISHSMLVKTALFGSDGNWGRIMAAVGRSGVPVDAANCSLHIGDLKLFQNGAPIAGVSETALKEIMSKPEISLTVSLGTGSAAAQVYTTDLSVDYVGINADYRS